MKKKYQFLVLSNPVEGREDEYNDWYTNQHLDDILKLPGAVAAKRFKLTDVQRAEPPHEYKYLAVYDIETDDLTKFTETLKQKSAAGELARSTALGPKRLSLIFEQFAEKTK